MIQEITEAGLLCCTKAKCRKITQPSFNDIKGREIFTKLLNYAQTECGVIGVIIRRRTTADILDKPVMLKVGVIKERIIVGIRYAAVKVTGDGVVSICFGNLTDVLA